MATCSTGTVACIFCTVLILFISVGVPLIFVFTGHKTKNPTFTVESSTVKAYNLTSDNNRLFCIINLGVRVHNPNPKKDSFSLYGIDMEVRKGKHHKLADDMLLGFDLSPGGDKLVPVEAVGLHVGLERKIAAELRADAVAGEGRVNVFMTGYVDSDYLGVTCKNVVVDFSRSTVRLQNADCRVKITHPNTDSG